MGPLAGAAALVGRLDGLGEQLDDLGQRLHAVGRGLRPRIPRKLAAGRGTGAVPATFLFLDLGGPAENGRAWDVKRYVVSLGDPSATSTATVWPFIGAAQPPDSANEPATFPDLVDMSAGLGSTGNASATWGDGELTLFWGEHLLFCIKGAPANAVITITGQAMEYEIDHLEAGHDRAHRHGW